VVVGSKPAHGGGGYCSGALSEIESSFMKVFLVQVDIRRYHLCRCKD